MSGGSFDYIGFKSEFINLYNNVETLERMLDFITSPDTLHRLPKAEAEIRKVLALIGQAEKLACEIEETWSEFAPVAREIEYFASGDHGFEDVIKVYEKVLDS